MNTSNYIIRSFNEQDAPQVGRLIADTYKKYNLSFTTSENQQKMLGPFKHAFSDQPEHQKAIENILRAPFILVAETEDQIVGVLRGRKERLASLFVHEKYHNQGIGRELVRKFESEMMAQNVEVIRLAASLYAVPFYMKLGYKKSTGIRTTWSFDGYGLQVQPLKKKLISAKHK